MSELGETLKFWAADVRERYSPIVAEIMDEAAVALDQAKTEIKRLQQNIELKAPLTIVINGEPYFPSAQAKRIYIDTADRTVREQWERGGEE